MTVIKKDASRLHPVCPGICMCLGMAIRPPKLITLKVHIKTPQLVPPPRLGYLSMSNFFRHPTRQA